MNARSRFGSTPRTVILAVAALGFGGVVLAQPPAPQGQEDGMQENHPTKRRKKPVAPAEPTCNCYFSGDCPAGNTCYWGPGGPFVEDHCEWQLPKPSGQVGAGCTSETELPGGCDGLCTNPLNGSIPGSEDPALVALAIDLWSLAFVGPAAQGGGPVDPDIGAAVFALPFENPHTPEILGRMVGGIFVVGAGQDFFFPDPALGIPPGHCAPGILLHHVVDMSGPGEAWRLDVVRNLVELLHAEMVADAPAAASALQRIAACAPDTGTAFQPVCGGKEALVCVRGRVHDVAMAVVTPITTRY